MAGDVSVDGVRQPTQPAREHAPAVGRLLSVGRALAPDDHESVRLPDSAVGARAPHFIGRCQPERDITVKGKGAVADMPATSRWHLLN